MNALELLLGRQSNPFLMDPPPSGEALENILNAGMKAPDHGALTPWHFTLVTGQGLDKLSDIFVEVAINKGADENKIAKAKNMPYRAPLIIVISTRFQAHGKVPQQEQLVAAGCAAHAMQMAAFAQGYGAMWRTGELSYIDEVKAALNIEITDEIVGFLYVGSIKKALPTKSVKSFDEYVSYL